MKSERNLLDHVVSAATGHQRSELRPSRQQYFSLRSKKIEEQTAAAEMKVLSGVRVYINGYLRDTTDIEMKRIVAEAGGQILCVTAPICALASIHRTPSQTSGLWCYTHPDVSAAQRIENSQITHHKVQDQGACGQT